MVTFFPFFSLFFCFYATQKKKKFFFFFFFFLNIFLINKNLLINKIFIKMFCGFVSDFVTNIKNIKNIKNAV